jgi:hypothetical protein
MIGHKNILLRVKMDWETKAKQKAEKPLLQTSPF